MRKEAGQKIRQRAGWDFLSALPLTPSICDQRYPQRTQRCFQNALPYFWKGEKNNEEGGQLHQTSLKEGEMIRPFCQDGGWGAQYISTGC